MAFDKLPRPRTPLRLRQVAVELILAGADPTLKNFAKPLLPDAATTDPEIYELAKLVLASEDANQVCSSCRHAAHAARAAQAGRWHIE